MRKLVFYIAALCVAALWGCEKSDPQPSWSVWDGTVTEPADLADRNAPQLTDENGIPYREVTVNSASELAWLRNPGDEDKFNRLFSDYGYLKFVLTTDIDLGGLPWVPIGEYFSHAFDGRGHKIKNLNVSGCDYAGLFSVLHAGFEDWGGVIENLHIESGTVTGNKSAGGICANIFWRGKISNCSNAAKITSTDTYMHGYAGGICGEGELVDDTNFLIEHCLNTGHVSGHYAGGIAGNGWVRNSENRGAVAATGTAGGIISTGYAQGCANRGTVTAHIAGGIVGSLYFVYYNPTCVQACYNTGPVTGRSLAGGICGYLWQASIHESFNTGPVSAPGAGAICGEAQFTYTRYCYWAPSSSAASIGPFGFSNGFFGGANYLMNKNQWPKTEGDSQSYRWALRTEHEEGHWKSLGRWNGIKPIYPVLWWE